MSDPIPPGPCQAIGCEARVHDPALCLCAKHARLVPHNVVASCLRDWKNWMRSVSPECLDILDLHQFEAMLECAVAEGRLTRAYAEARLGEARAKVLGGVTC